MKNFDDATFTRRQSIKTVWRGLKITAKIWPNFVPLTIGLNTIDAAKPLIALFFSARILNALASGGDIKTVALYVGLLVGIIFVLSVIGGLISQKLDVVSGIAIHNMDFLYCKQYMEMEYPHVEDSEVNAALSNIMFRARGNGLGLAVFLSRFGLLVKDTATVIGAIILLAGMFIASGEYVHNFITSPASTLILVAFGAISLANPFLVGKMQKSANDLILKENPRANRMLGYYYEYKDIGAAAKDIRLYDQSNTLIEIYKKRLNHSMWIWFFRRLGVGAGVSGAISAVVGAGIYIYIGLRALYGMYPVGSVVQYVGAVSQLILTIHAIATDLNDIFMNVKFMANIFEYLDLSVPKTGEETRPLPAEMGEIQFKNVSFKYPGAEEYALENLNLVLKPNRRLAVVGMNGSGKTTMVKLLTRLYQPESGEILLNGQDISAFDMNQYINKFAVVFQDFHLFALPLGENVAAAKDYNKEAVMDALSKAGFTEKLNKMEKGLDSVLGRQYDESGTPLSGGEEQKLAIARAIYKNSPLVVFDEPTAALDPVSEHEIYSQLGTIVGDKTAVFISHRLSSCRFCDDIAVFDKGKIVQYGTHDSLLQDESGKYAELWHAQAQYYN